LLNSAFCTTIGLLPIMMTLPARTSCAIFMAVPGGGRRFRQPGAVDLGNR
jgi:hypothetical protein